MTNVATVVARLAGLGVSISIEDGELQCRAPRAVATREIMSLISANKPAILGHLAAGVDYPDEPPATSDIGPNAPATFTPPEDCFGRHACPILGVCRRARAGHPCLYDGPGWDWNWDPA